ncbi:MAG: radical SAM protein [Sandaracinaceae bacterium]|nr:radical SAM protein [Sandaracinaceae bacterium]
MKGLTYAIEAARALYQARTDWQHPLHLIHAVTARCNARCGFCAWNPDFYPGNTDLDTDDVRRLYRDAREAGFLSLSMWGGEPLVRKDIGELARYAKELGFATSMVTNGALLERKMDEVMPWIDRVAISVDHPSSQHDVMRKIPGLFARIERATAACRERYPAKKIAFNYTLMKNNADLGSITRMAELAEGLDVSVVFNAMRTEVAASDAEGVDLAQYAPSREQIVRAFEHVRALKRRGLPVVNSYTHLEEMAAYPPRYRCHWPKLMLPVEANGDVVDCMHWGTRPIGNVRDTSLAELLRHPRLRELAGPAGERCHECVSLHRVEISKVWEGRLEPLVSWGRNML